MSLVILDTCCSSNLCQLLCDLEACWSSGLCQVEALLEFCVTCDWRLVGSSPGSVSLVIGDNWSSDLCHLLFEAS